MLTILRLHSCEGITSASMAAIAHSSMLEVCFVPDIDINGMSEFPSIRMNT
jgi:hypothetical protein